ncbi:MAG: hypothetical protein ACP5NS_04425 [Candidatus Pacearchaeota archaeon]
MAKTRKSKQGLDTMTLLAGAIGVSPIPVLGEIGLGYFFYKVLKNVEQTAVPPLVAIPAALLTRFSLYQQMYAPLYERLFN